MLPADASAAFSRCAHGQELHLRLMSQCNRAFVTFKSTEALQHAEKLNVTVPDEETGAERKLLLKRSEVENQVRVEMILRVDAC
eukprot:SAG31_NODE_4057_length_3630_cov_3.786746_3_plen_84_part_00